MAFSNIKKFLTGKLRMIAIEGDSMSPTIKNGDLKWVDYSKNTLEILKIGDIVLFRNPFGKNLIVKRINNIDIEKGFWMKGDNKNILESTDSETFGHVKSQNIKGKVLI